ncbi:cobyric acid synthase [Aneurinibacillus sp. Ricciae_BoGa-3]|uniref:cobyric acid synthase n=1 Tax=Aneurinibacillus sp. Ricciae_BoGa-3 TaxID=3022697 RepID=UPI00233FCAD4|nr:cobyric acid synthase [Aneurinibacillus sp. Ricciae_BoGa-3]WCK56479.1 cobyric acid synthase [Aneurinibacillus sp. Ricciae_BoGa-3]
MAKALPLMIQGTHSDAGKSIMVTAFCRIFAQQGFCTAPFKSQNMALNSYITLDGKEIGRAQGVQAEAAGIVATTDMNPILIKPTRDNESQIVLHGEPYKNMEASNYRSEFYERGLKIIHDSYTRLAEKYERIVIEGAGSPAEVNLNARELVNMRVARLTNSPVILVGDIERGGVFASLVGTLQLLDPEDRDRVIGVIINKFRGDIALLEPGVKWFEEYTGKPVLGVVPYMDGLTVDSEDSVILDRRTPYQNPAKEIDIAVIQYPRISNFTDADPFFAEPDCHVRFVKKREHLKNPDIVILPGSKNTIEDLQFLQQSGLADEIKNLCHNKTIKILAGICGGYQMLGQMIEDPHEMESRLHRIDGLALLPIRTTISTTKTTMLSTGSIRLCGENIQVEGYEIHMGESYPLAECVPFIYLDGRCDGVVDETGSIIGTYFHGIFHNDLFRERLLNSIRTMKGLPPITNRVCFNALQEQAFDELAAHVRRHIELPFIEEKMKQFQLKAK